MLQSCYRVEILLRETIENQPRLKKFNLNSVLTCNIYTNIEVLQIAVIFPDKGTYYMNM